MSSWREQLLASPSFAAHLLPAKSDVVTTPNERRDLGEFLDRLSSKDRDLVATGLDLTTAGYGDFLDDILPTILDNLARVRRSEIADIGPAIIGHPDWPQTIQRWETGSLQLGKYQSRIALNTFDLPENRAVKLLVDALFAAALGISKRLGGNVHPEVRRIARGCQIAARHPGYLTIGPTEGPSEGIVAAAEGSRNVHYRTVGKLLRRRICLSGIDDLTRWREAALKLGEPQGLFLPTNEEHIFELLALSRTLDVLEHSFGLGKPTSFWMRIATRFTSGPIAVFSDGKGGNVEVYFNRTPAPLLAGTTRYKEVFERHSGLGDSADRRPDVVVVYEPARPNSRRILFIEAKLPGQEVVGTYVRNSIYKAFGYLYDFSTLWLPEQDLRAVLFIPNAAEPDERALQGRAAGLAIVSADRPDLLSLAFHAALSLP